MSSKQLDSILKNIPPATVQPSPAPSPTTTVANTSTQPEATKPPEELFRIVARIPSSLKDEIKQYLRQNRKETESILVLKGLKSLGFNVKDEWLVDKRTLR
jgi:hypothetical protein